MGGSNLSGFQSVKLDPLLEAARAYAPQSTRATRVAAVEADLAQELPILPLVYSDFPYVVRDTVQGPAPRLRAPGSEFPHVLHGASRSRPGSDRPDRSGPRWRNR